MVLVGLAYLSVWACRSLLPMRLLRSLTGQSDLGRFAALLWAAWSVSILSLAVLVRPGGGAGLEVVSHRSGRGRC